MPAWVGGQSSAHWTPFAGIEPAVGALLTALVAAFVLSCRRSRHEQDAAQQLCRASTIAAQDCESSPWLAPEPWEADTESRFCPVCRAEFLPGTGACDDCAVELVDEEDLPERDVRIQESVVRIARMDDSFQGMLIREMLSANRVPCSVHRSPWDPAGAHIYVFESDAVRAKGLLRHFFGQRAGAA